MLQLRSAIHAARRTPQRRRSIVGDTPPWFVSLPEGFTEGQLVEAMKTSRISKEQIDKYALPQFQIGVVPKPKCMDLGGDLFPFCSAGMKAADDIFARRGFSEENVSKVVQRGMMYEALSKYVFLTDTTPAGRALIDTWLDNTGADPAGNVLREGLRNLLAGQWLLNASQANPEAVGSGMTTTTTTDAPPAAAEGPGLGTWGAVVALAAAAWYFLWGPGKKGRR